MIRVTAGVEAHTHEYIATAHEDQKFGFSITNGDAWRAVAAGPGSRRAEPPRPPLPHRQPDLRQLRLRGGRATRARPAGPRSARSSASRSPEMDLGGGFGIAYTTQDDPSRPRAARHRDDQDRRARVPRARDPRAAPVDRARPRDRRPVGLHRLHRGHRQAGRPGRRRGPHVRQRRRRDERQHPHGAVRRRLLVHRRLPRQRGAAGARPRGRQALRGRRHRGRCTSSCPPTSVPAT